MPLQCRPDRRTLLIGTEHTVAAVGTPAVECPDSRPSAVLCRCSRTRYNAIQTPMRRRFPTSPLSPLSAHMCILIKRTVAAGGHPPDFVLVTAHILRPDPYVGRLRCAPNSLPCNIILLGETATSRAGHGHDYRHRAVGAVGVPLLKLLVGYSFRHCTGLRRIAPSIAHIAAHISRLKTLGTTGCKVRGWHFLPRMALI
jgi:hypothetical protein